MEIPQSSDDLKKQLLDQIEFLKTSANAYDNGLKEEAKRMATTIRVLLHDTTKSHSLLGQMNLKNRKFLSTASKTISIGPNQQQVGSYAGLIGIYLGSGANGFVPNFESMPKETITGYVDFNHYWNEIIFIDKEKNNHSRKDVILSVANKDGGAHVAPGLDEKYAKLSRQNSLGWMSSNDKKWLPVSGAELAAVRQIAYEILRSLDPNYPIIKELPIKGNGIIVGGCGFVLETQEEKSLSKVGRNDTCPCGSGKKYKKCHGK
ncbi:MAG: SEC-C metal-binding domain-containing protein [Candidatus Pacebacteria bacterium]|nr:SEC-C metal-binding domain-containing protein [Candidatus Paceibacterota bacterium]